MQEISDLKMMVLDLQRRVTFLEGAMYGHAAPQIGEHALIRSYLDIHRVPLLTKKDQLGSWVHVAYLLDVRALARVGKAIRDPYPWRPYLLAMDHCVHLGVAGALGAQKHILSLAEDFLVALGLELVEPRDIKGLFLHEVMEHLG